MARESRCQLPNAFPSINLPFGILFSENHLISVEFLMTLHRERQANMGAKNHAVILPDANPEATVAALTGAAFGAAGQR